RSPRPRGAGAPTGPRGRRRPERSAGSRIDRRRTDRSGGSRRPMCRREPPERGSARISGVGRLDELDLTLSLSRAEQEERLESAQTRLLRLRLAFGGLIGESGIGPPVCVLFEGWDASGKG